MTTNAASRTAAQELSDWFYGLQMTVKVMEGLMIEYENGTRSKEDYESRFNANAHLLADNLKKIKPLTEKLISEGYSKYGRSECLDTESDVHSGGSDELVNGS
jgi:hypothetical protein